MYDEMPVHPMDRELPRFTLKQEELPEVSGWGVNEKHYLILKVEMVAKRNTKAIGVNDHSDREKIEGTFQVESVKALGDKPVDAKSLEREDFNRVYMKARAEK